jgi:hypothetical protein
MVDEQRVFSDFCRARRNRAIQHPQLPFPYLFLGFFISLNQRTWSTSAINREKAFDETLPGMEHT